MPTPIQVPPKPVPGVGYVVIISSDDRPGKVVVTGRTYAEKNGDSSRIAGSKLARDNVILCDKEDKQFGVANVICSDEIDILARTTLTYVWTPSLHGPVRNEHLEMQAQFIPIGELSEPVMAGNERSVSARTETGLGVECQIDADAHSGKFRLVAIGKAEKNTADGIEAGLTVFVNNTRMFGAGDHAFDATELRIEESFPATARSSIKVRAELSLSYAAISKGVEVTLFFTPQG